MLYDTSCLRFTLTSIPRDFASLRLGAFVSWCLRVLVPLRLSAFVSSRHLFFMVFGGQPNGIKKVLDHNQGLFFIG